MSLVTDAEEPNVSYDITGAIAGPKSSSKKGKAVSVLGAVVVAGLVAAFSARKKSRGGPAI
jgi:hypothetical protein